jgi:hypothetical protein
VAVQRQAAAATMELLAVAAAGATTARLAAWAQVQLLLLQLEVRGFNTCACAVDGNFLFLRQAFCALGLRAAYTAVTLAASPTCAACHIS